MNTSLETIESLYHISVQPQGGEWTVGEAYAFCKRLTHSHYENFPVGSVLIPKRLRHHVHAIYAFARISDDFADEPIYDGVRMERLDDWDFQLQECYQGRAEHPVFIALAQTVRELDLPMQLFRDLLHAFKMDVTVSRYTDFDMALNYCRYSANPVGRLILHLFGYRDEERFHWSDCICTALQLANFWQDVAIDLKKDRIYIPQDDMREFGYSEEELFNHVYDERFKQLLRRQVLRTWRLFAEGYPLVDRVRFPLSAELRFTWLGGASILERTLTSHYHAFEKRPKLGKWDFMKLGIRSFRPVHSRFRRLESRFASA